MQTLYGAVLAGLVGTLVGAAVVYVAGQEKEPTAPAVYGEEQLVGLLERMHENETLLRDIQEKLATVSSAQMAPPPNYSGDNIALEPEAEGMTLDQDRSEIPTPDMAVEEAVVQNIITRLYDPVYTASTTLPELMQSEEMLQLSPQSRERVVAQMVGMLNRGEIDPETFLPGSRPVSQ